MKLLEWISFGTWHVPILPSDYDFVKSMTIAFFVLMFLKFLAIVIADFDYLKKNYLAMPIVFGVRLLQIFFYTLLYCVMGLFHTPGAYYAVILLGIYFIFCGIVYITNEKSGDYVWKINENLKDVCEGWGTTINDKIKRNTECKRINKKIYDYRKTAIIG